MGVGPNKVLGPKSKQTKKPQEGEPHGGKKTTKYWNFHQSHETYQLKKGEVNLIKLQAYKNFPLQ